MLLDLGVPNTLIGHRQLVKAISIVYEDPGIIYAISKELYPAVAKATGTTPSRVERGIRHAIEVAMERMDWDTLRKYFGNTISPSKGKPTNGEFIARVTAVIRERIVE